MAQASADRDRFTSDYRQCQTDPARDCSRERDLAARSDQRWLQASNEYNDLSARIRDLQTQRDNFRYTIEREVDADYQQLVSEERDAISKTNQAVADANAIANEINQLQSVDLPQAQSNLNAWQNARAQAEADVRSAAGGVATAQRNVQGAQADVDTAETRRDSWRQSSGYNTRARAVSSAQDAVDQIKATLASLDKGIASREKLIRTETAALTENEAAMKKAVDTIALKEARSIDVQKMLEPYFAQRDVLAATKADADRRFEEARAAFAAGLTPVAPTPAPAPAPVAPVGPIAAQ
jgi:chromosome segregation ATPase